MKEIKLPCGKVAFVSDEDWPRVSRMAWYDRHGGYPAARWKKAAGGDGRIVQLHRFVMAAPAGYVVDHIDGNTLNCTREHLQITTNSRNMMRSPKKQGGVEARRGTFYARIRVDGEILRLGKFSTREEAETAVSNARDEAWGGAANVLGTVR